VLCTSKINTNARFSRKNYIVKVKLFNSLIIEIIFKHVTYWYIYIGAVERMYTLITYCTSRT